jgi:hypothetical protein
MPSGYALNSGQGTNSVSVSNNGSNASITMISSNACGNSSSSASLAITPRTAPATPGAITGTQAECLGTSFTYSISSVSGATSYTWSVPSGWVISSGQGTTSISGTVGSGTSNISVVANNTCGSSTASQLAITVTNAVPSNPTITGNQTPCVGSASNYTASSTGANTYVWTVPTGYTLNSGQGANVSNVSVNSSNGTLQVVAINACGFANNTGTLNITPITAPTTPSAITGITAECLGTTFNYSIPSVPTATSYTWTVPTGWSITSGQGSTSVSGTVGAGQTTVKVTASNACGTSSASQVNVTVTNSIPSNPSISGTQTPCSGSMITYTASSSGATSYVWTVPTSYTLNAGQGTNMADVTIPGVNGTIQVVAMNACGFSNTNGTRNITPVVSPTAVDSIVGPGYANYLDIKNYTTNVVANATSYQWTVPTSGWNINSGQTTTSLDVTVGYDSGYITVTPFNGGCAGPTTQKYIRVNPIPLPVMLVNFSGTYANNAVKLNWTTATEINNDRFEVERSVNARTWNKIAVVKGKGNTMTTTNYDTTDRLGAGFNAKTIYYRLRQVDFDGKFEYSPIVKINIVPNASDDKVWFNNAIQAIQANVECYNAGSAIITLVNLEGKTVITENVSVAVGSNKITIPAQLPAGIYNVLINNNKQEVKTFKVIKY